MSAPIIFIDTSEIREGKLPQLKKAISGLVDFVESCEPRPHSYSVYLNEDETRMTVIQFHPDSASMESHMREAAPAFPKFAELVELSTMDVYGRPSDDLLKQLRQKVEMLGRATVVVHELHAGVVRF
jgi:hypothetical protein